MRTPGRAAGADRFACRRCDPCTDQGQGMATQERGVIPEPVAAEQPEAGAGRRAAEALLGPTAWALAYFSTHPPRLPILSTPARHGMPFEEVALASRDGTRLAGWRIPADRPEGAVVLCHGHPFHRGLVLPWAAMLWPCRWDLLLLDFRAAGRSAGSLCTLGHDEVGDLEGAVNWLRSEPRTARHPIGVFGVSLGGAVALLTAADDGRIAAVATHGAFATLDRAIEQRGRLLLGPAGPLLSSQARRIGRRWLPVDPEQVAPVAAIARIAPRPVLLFHGRRDCIVSCSDALLLYEAAGEPRQLHLLQRASHVDIPRGERDAYAARLRAFFSAALHRPGAA